MKLPEQGASERRSLHKGAREDKHEENREFFRGDLTGTAPLHAGRGSFAFPDFDIGGGEMNRQEYIRRLAYDDLTDEQVLRGFAEHYLCAGMSTRAVCRDVCLAASATAARETGERLMKVFRKLAGEADAI